MIAAKLANMPPHRPDDKTANLQTSRAEAAKLLNVSERTVNTAKKEGWKRGVLAQQIVETVKVKEDFGTLNLAQQDVVL